MMLFLKDEVKLMLLVWVVSVYLVSGTSVKGGSRGVKGGSSQQFSRFSQSQVEEPVVSRKTYPESESIGTSTCIKPMEPINGRLSCQMINNRHLCKGICDSGYKYADGSESLELECSKSTGQWTPFRNFPPCEGSHESSYRTSVSEQVPEPTVSRKTYSESESVAASTCIRPMAPMNGRITCQMINNRHLCKGICNPGYKFPDGKESFELECSRTTGQWTPYRNFQACGGSYGDGYEQSESTYISHRDSRYKTSAAEQGAYSQTYGHGSSVKTYSQGLCGQPASPMNGAHHCSMTNGQWTCQGTCNPGYEFPDRSRQVTSTCNDRDGQWHPKKDFDECKLLCHPPCENGGRCAVHNQCMCPSSHRGNRCQYSIQLCDFNRLSTGSLHSDCTHNSEYSECRISCPPGLTFNPPSTSIYRCTVDGKWNPPIAPQCGRDSLCETPPSPTNGRIECRESSEIKMCTGSCQPGYIFQDGFTELSIQCVKRSGEWTPTLGFPNCEAICSPECLNGGKCLGHNNCLCPREFRGSRCEYPLSNCDGHDRFASVTWQCQTNSKETVCSVCCNSGSTLQPSQPTKYTCSLDGTWQPDLKPICVTDFSNLERSRTRYERYEDHGQGSSWGSSHRRTGYQQIEHRYSQEQQGIDYEFGGQQQIGHEFGGQEAVGHEFGGQQVMNHEFGGRQDVVATHVDFNRQQTVGHEFGGQQVVGHEFGGQQAIGHEFGGQQVVGHEFGGQQAIGHEFGGQQVVGHEFGGQQAIGHEFGGQQVVGHEFGGQQVMNHEFGGQQITDHDFGGQQVVGHEFGGQQVMNHDFGGQQVMNHDFGGQQVIGHEFGGQQSLEDDSFDEPIQRESVKSVVETSSAVKTSKGKSPSPTTRRPERLVVYDDGSTSGKGVSSQREVEADAYGLSDDDSREVLTQLDIGDHAIKTTNIFSSKRKASNYRGICSTWGFYHFRTFDGGIYTFPSSCWYILATSSVDKIVISVKSDCNGKTDCIRTVSIQCASNRYILSYANGLSRNGVSLPIPVQDGDLVVEYISRYLVARTNFGYAIWINDENSVLVVAEPYMQNQTRGMCGNYDTNLDLFFENKDGSKSTDIFSFATSWKSEELDGVCVDEVEPKAPCSSETREKRMESDKANLACAAFFNAEFEVCGEVLDADVYYLKCQMDCCSKSSVENCECASLSEFVLECSRAGVDMTKGWRQPGLCPLSCKNGTEYKECGQPCPSTCSDQQPTCSQQKCVDGCHCPQGTVLEGEQCILIDDCPCHYSEKIYSSGETVEQDCNTCMCQGGNWQCTESLCPTTCSVFGPHVTTFDDFHYDFHGKCSHYLVVGNDFNVQVDYTVNCRGRNPESGVCVDGITIHTPEEAVVKILSNMEIIVNGREMKSLPVVAPGVYIGQSTSTYIRAQMKNGLEVLWDFGSSIQVYSPVELFGVVKGLCGTFTKNQHDEFLTPEGDIETSSGVFAHKWRVEESCRDIQEPNDPEGNEKACDIFPERRDLAAETCRVFKGDVFKECHDLLDFERYFSNCMEDVCSCQDEPIRCACLSFANYAAACARKDKPVSWRLAVPECGISCPHSQVYLACANPCSYTCSEIAQSPSPCRESCVEGCVCPPGQTLNEHRQCTPVSMCSCLHSGHFYPPEFLQRRGQQMCECSQGNWDCHKATPEDLILTPPLHIAEHCETSSHQVATDCKTDCPLTCSNYHHHQPCTVAVCVPGCRCQDGFILDTTTGNCVTPHECPCHHGGRSFVEGEEIKMDCHNCVCEGGSWKCDTSPCPGLCSAWGESHYETFDGKLFDFDGTCDYVLAKAKISEQEFFSVVVQNVPCGVGSKSSCGKTVSITLGESSVTLTRVHPLPIVPINSKLRVTSIGMFTLVDTEIGISIQWDRNTRVYVTAQPIWKNKMTGLCGDFNADATDDFRPPSGGRPLVLAKDFADSWRVHKFCPQAKHTEDSCEVNPERRSWSRQKCGVLKSDLFKPCHFQVEVEDYYSRCTLDACGCDSGGDCECLCAVVATYAQKCARSGVIIPWRSQDLCPVQCEACDHYSPCISLCPPLNCDTYLNAPDSKSCNREYCVEGCETKPCMIGQVHKSTTNVTCVPEELCDDKPCIVIDGVPYREGERINRPDVGDACQSCYCRRGEVDCTGVPCTLSTTTFRPLEFEILTACEFTGWTEWINSLNPEDNEGNDAENLEELAKSHRIPCPLDHVKSIQCRSVKSQTISEATGQNVTCNINEGMKCWKKASTGDCLDYEIKVYCQCREEAICPPGQEWDECAFDCEHSCQSFKVEMKEKNLCDGLKCAAGCAKKVCQPPYLARDAEVCVMPDECTCRLDSGYVLAPGQVVTNGCEKCQCLNNTLICSATVECKKPEPEEVKPFEQEEDTQFEVVTFKPIPIAPKVTPASRGLVLTTPVCSYWSEWINKGKPKNGRRYGDREATRPYILRQTEGFCMKGSITEIECREATTDLDYSETNEEKLTCNLNRGFQCQNRHQPDERCLDYKIRYFCSCSELTTPVPLLIQTTPQTYIYPCVEFVPLIDGPNRLPDSNLKASSSESSFSGPDGARFQVLGAKGARRTWTAGESNEKQFIEVDVGEVRGIYGIITKGKELSSEWVTSYQILYSIDGVSYCYYQDENENNKIFNGNFDDTNEVKHLFKPPFEAKLIRIEPLTWERKISLKLELLGCLEALTQTAEPFFPFILGTPPSKKGIEHESRSHVLHTTPAPPKECMEPIGIENGALHDSQFSATSSFSSVFTPENARLGSESVWAAAVSEDEQYLQVDFVDEANITGIVTKGREDVSQWVTAFVVTYSKDGIIWNKIKNEEGTSLKEFPANYDPYTTVTNEFPAMIRARLLRIWPTNWKNWISMQIEILGCYQPQPCREPMGIDDGLVTNHQLSSSSKLSQSHSASRGRLSSTSSWTPAKNDKKPFIQVDLLEPLKITSVISKGDKGLQQWVKSYFVAYSNDSLSWKKVENYNGKAKEFKGNDDNNAAVINTFPILFISRYVQIIPTKWHRFPSMRIELLGCLKEQECREPMGLENGVLSDGQITASSSLDWKSTPAHARISDENGWIADTFDVNPYLQVDFIQPRNVSAVVTKGSEPHDYWVTKYKVTHSIDGEKWFPVIDDYGDVIQFLGNHDRDSPVVNTLQESIDARYFRIIPLNYENKIGLRLELLGCYHPFTCQEPMGMASGTIYDFQIKASSSASPLLGPSNSRLDSDMAWVADLTDDSPYLQVDFITPTNITGIMTRGRNDANEWVKSYEVAFSNDGFSWSNVLEENEDRMEFKGNFDNESPVSNMFPRSVVSRFFRIKPILFEKKVSLRLEILGCPQTKVCMEPMGLENGVLSDSQITASSFKTDKTDPSKARLNSESSWSAAATEGAPQYLKVDLSESRNISAVVTKGNNEKQEWVTSYQVTYSQDGIKWTPIRNSKGEVIEFPGNTDSDTAVTNVLPETIETQYIKIIPTDWKNWISMRVEILGCYHPYELSETTTTKPEEEVKAMTHFATEPNIVAACPNPAEIESSLLSEADIQASSSTTSRIALNTRGDGVLSGGWVPQVEDLHPFLVVELPEVEWITSIFVQGREDEENWIKSLRVIASQNNKTWLPVFGLNGDEVIEGNSDQNSIVRHYFKRPMEAKYIKIIPETWHKWPSFRFDLRGCHMEKVAPIALPTLVLCPELAREPDIEINCPSDCSSGLVCDGEKCVDPVDCSCFHEGKIFKVSDKIEDHSCMQCDCALGGRTICTKKICPTCSEHERPTLNDDCSCSCKSCEKDEIICPSSHECIPKQRWCDGIVDCPDDETNCIFTSTEIPTTTTEFVLPTSPPEPENATCDVMGKHIKTFDGQDITYEICHHVVMKDIINGHFNATLHKECDYAGDCKHWLELMHKRNNVKVFSDLRVEFNGHNYTASQLSRLSEKSKARHLLIRRVGDQVTLKSLLKGFTLVYDTNAHLKIEVVPTLMKRIGGLCGYYSGIPEDDQKKPDGKKAFTSQEFGDSWTSEDKDCAPIICPHEVMAKALEQCNKLRNEPFGGCSKVLPIEHFIEFCMSSMCECMLHNKNSDEKCKCDSFQPFAEACENELGPMAIRNWRFIHRCHSECPPGMEWNDCGPSCQLTCDSNSELEQCSEKCVPGCFCPPGTVLSEDKCITPDRCADQLCQGFGDPHFMTFDGLFFPFQAEGMFLIVGDKENDFTLNGFSRKCNIFTHITCLTGLQVLYKENKVTIKKHREIEVNGVKMPMDKLPLYSNGMVILGYPGRTFVVSIPLMNLEARYYEDNSGFAVKVPSKKYFNKTEGLCGNCNGKKDDELKEKPLSEFVCSHQTEGDQRECKKSMEDLPELSERVPLCQGLENPVFEACHPLIDSEVYIDACSFDAVHSGQTKAAFCKTAMEYARQCCQAGITIEDWPQVLDCEVKCPEGLKYRQCHEGCPQTCISLKDKSQDSTCNQLKIDGCFCPEGKVLKNETCVDTILCDTCDEDGHVPGDEWKNGKCKKCHCKTDLTTECSVEVCPSKPICSTHEMLAKVNSELEDSCCESYSCIPKIENCPQVDVPDCPKGEVAKITTRRDLCAEFRCECDPALCPPIVWPSDLEDGQVAEMVNDSCCRKMHVTCHPPTCPQKPQCRKGLELTEMEGECCIKYKCKPPEDVCVYTNTYKIVDGLQIALKSGDTTTSLHKPGDEWGDGLCEKCKCVQSNGQHAPLCVVEQCPRLEDLPENKEYVLHEMKIPGKCCPEIFRINCKDEDGNIYEEGEHWSDPNDPCINYMCEPKEIGEVQKAKNVINCTDCPRTAVYFPPSKILGQCCGICQVTKCEEDEKLYSVGDTWVSDDYPCRKAECIKDHGSIKIVYTKQSCPTIPKDCPKNQIAWDNKGCCEICNATSEISCSTGPIPEADTVGFFTYRDENHGGMCVNEQPVSNVLKCSGACHSQSYYSLEDGDFKDTCKCCKVNITINRTVDLTCPDRSQIKKTFVQPETCQCSKCAPKPGSRFIDKYQATEKPQPWRPSVKTGWGDVQTSEFGQIPIEIGQQLEREDGNFEQIGRFIPGQEVQQQDYDNMFQQNQEVQQQQQDYDNLFQQNQEVQQQQQDYDNLFQQNQVQQQPEYDNLFDTVQQQQVHD